MRYFRFGLTQRDQARVAINTTTGPACPAGLTGPSQRAGHASGDGGTDDHNDPSFYRAVIPSANLYCTAEEMSRFYQMLLNDVNGRAPKSLNRQPYTMRPAGGKV